MYNKGKGCKSFPFLFISNIAGEISHMQVTYSKKVITKIIKGVDGEERIYKATKMSAPIVATEGYKLLRAILPSLGATLDDMGTDEEDFFERKTTYTAAFQLLYNNLTVEHFQDLQEKLTGSLIYFDEPIKLDHFDEHVGDYLEVLAWLFKENFVNFILESGMLRSKIQTLKTMLQENPKMNELLGNVLNVAKQDTQTSQESI